MTLADHDGQLNYQELVNHIYQTNTFDFVGLALKSDDFSRNINGTLWPEINPSNSEKLSLEAVLELPGWLCELVNRFGRINCSVIHLQMRCTRQSRELNRSQVLLPFPSLIQ